MPTGACGINCDVCKLHLLGLCGSCGPGTSPEADRKLEAQERQFGETCTILACAVMNQADHCIRDCQAFPCENFQHGPYPYSQGFLAMQARRLAGGPLPLDPNGRLIRVPSEYWDTLRGRDRNTLLNMTLFSTDSSGGLVFPFLGEQILVDVKDRCLKRREDGAWQIMSDPLLELVTLLYLNHVKAVYPLGRDMVGPEDLKEAHYFKGPHELKVASLIQRYGHDEAAFEAAARYLNGTPMDMADKAYRLLPFPRVPLYYLLWKGDDEFGPAISVLFDRSIESCFSASAIWGLVTRVSFSLLKGPRRKIGDTDSEGT